MNYMKELIKIQRDSVDAYDKITKKNTNVIGYVFMDSLIGLIVMLIVFVVIEHLKLPIYFNVIGFSLFIWYMESEYSLYIRKSGLSHLIRAERACKKLSKIYKQHSKGV